MHLGRPFFLCFLLAATACTLPNSPDINNADMSVTLATPGGALHVLLVCPKPAGWPSPVP
jgi:hypothetical protein